MINFSPFIYKEMIFSIICALFATNKNTNTVLTKPSKVKATVFLGLLLIYQLGLTQQTSSEELFKNANIAFQNGDYCLAAEKFKSKVGTKHQVSVF